MKHLILAILVLSVTPSLSAQLSDVASMNSLDRTRVDNGFGSQPVSSPFSLIDMSKITWSNSYSVSFFSGGGQSASMGLLNTRMLYTVSS